MFKKPFHVKKNVNLKNSDIRKLLARIPGESSNVVDKKSQVAHVKAVTFHEVATNLYLFDKIPLFFDFEETGILVPTVYFLWKSPSVYPLLVVHEPVLQFLENGADLMLQGVAKSFPVPTFKRGDVVAIGLNIEGKVRPVAVGCALMSSDEVVTGKFLGKGVQTIHVVKDTLWEFGPRGTAHDFELEEIYPAPIDEKTENYEGTTKDTSIDELVNNVAATEIEEKTIEDDAEPDEPVEQLLQRCFIAALKYRLTKKATLPMDVGQFYSQCLLKCVPANRRLDMKKTKYKKFASFLDEHPDGAIIKLKAKGKGVDLIAEVNWDHPAIRHFEVTDERINDEEVAAGPSKGPTIIEYFAITENVLGFFNTFTKVTKGLLLTPADTRALITQYVKAENLAAGNGVRLDPLLGSLVKTDKDVVDWNTLMQNIQSKMTKTYVLKMPDGRELVKKMSIPKLVFKVETRSGNKKVTLLNNLAVFGLEAKVLCREIQVSMATSATTQEGAVNCEGPQLQVQGNQVAQIGEILMSQYGIDKKYIEGLDLAPKKKK